MLSLLENYPFKNIGIEVAEGFVVSKNNPRSALGGLPNGIDYILKKQEEYVSFEVFSMYEGHIRFGVSQKWGKFFVISKTLGSFQYDTVYAHLDFINEDIQKYAIIHGDMDFIIPGKYFLGMCGKTGDTKKIRQLHIELHEKNVLTGERKKLDPYGIYDRLSSGKYPKPGELLNKLPHAWVEDYPEFVV
jgi:hypothetical protein